MDGRNPAWAVCAVLALLACVVVPFGCGQARTSEGPSDAGPTPESTEQGAGVQSQMGGVSVGTGGGDVLRAGDGSQILRGLGGDDEIRGGEGVDRLSGGPGDDVIDAQDKSSGGKAGRDAIFCGPGRDEVLMDAEDGEKPKDCEMAGVGSS